jgi:phasin family protein
MTDVGGNARFSAPLRELPRRKDIHPEQQDTTMDPNTDSARSSAEKTVGTMLRTTEEQQKLSKENFDACVQASTIAAKGMQDLGQAWAAYLQGSMQHSAAAAMALMSARSMQEVVSLQSDWAKSCFEKFFAETTRLTEQSVKLTQDAMQPINQRLTVTAETMRMPRAA